MITKVFSVLIWCMFWELFLLMPIWRVRWWTILYCQSYPDALLNKLVLKHLLSKFVNVIKVKVHTLIANLSCRDLSKQYWCPVNGAKISIFYLSLEAQSSYNFILKHNKNRFVSNLHSKQISLPVFFYFKLIICLLDFLWRVTYFIIKFSAINARVDA